VLLDPKVNFARRVLIRLAVAVALAVVGVVAAWPFIVDFYFTNQLTKTGYVINGGILVLFAVGLLRITSLLFRYLREERAIGRFLRGVEGDLYHPIDSVPANSLILQRYKAILTLSKQHAPINQGALAATLVAAEGMRISLAKFVHNTLVLTGVFGTIVSLSIALLGASNLLEGVQGTSNMALVIHGMSTALSTTMTAIVCYVFFGYFYLKLLDAKAHVIGGIEQITSLYLMPKYSQSQEHLVKEVATLVQGLRETAESMREAQHNHAEAAGRLLELMDTFHTRTEPLAGDVANIKRLLQAGFRLPAEGEP